MAQGNIFLAAVVHRRRILGPQITPNNDVAKEQHGHQKTGDDNPGKKVADGLFNDRAVDDDDHGRWNDGPERPAGADRAGNQIVFVALLDHGRNRHHADNGFDRTDDAGAGGKHAAHGDRGQGKTAAQFPDPELDRDEQLFGNAGPFKRRTHKDEQRQCGEHVIGGNTVQLAEHLRAERIAEEPETEHE